MSRQLEALQPSLQASLDASGAGGGGAAAAIVGSALAVAAGSLSALAERLIAAALSMSRCDPGAERDLRGTLLKPVGGAAYAPIAGSRPACKLVWMVREHRRRQ